MHQYKHNYWSIVCRFFGYLPPYLRISSKAKHTSTPDLIFKGCVQRNLEKQSIITGSGNWWKTVISMLHDVLENSSDKSNSSGVSNDCSEHHLKSDTKDKWRPWWKWKWIGIGRQYPYFNVEDKSRLCPNVVQESFIYKYVNSVGKHN